MLVLWRLFSYEQRPRTLKFVPLFVHKVLGEGCIVAAAKATHVIIDGDEVVYFLLAVFLLQNSLGDIETFNREVDRDIDLVATGPAAAEPFEMDYKDVGRLPKIELLGRASVLFASGTVPFIILGQDLILLKLLQAVVQADAPVRTVLPGLALSFELRVLEDIQIQKRWAAYGRRPSIAARLLAAKNDIPRGRIPVNQDALAETDQRTTVHFGAPLRILVQVAVALIRLTGSLLLLLLLLPSLCALFGISLVAFDFLLAPGFPSSKFRVLLWSERQIWSLVDVLYVIRRCSSGREFPGRF